MHRLCGDGAHRLCCPPFSPRCSLVSIILHLECRTQGQMLLGWKQGAGTGTGGWAEALAPPSRAAVVPPCCGLPGAEVMTPRRAQERLCEVVSGVLWEPVGHGKPARSFIKHPAPSQGPSPHAGHSPGHGVRLCMKRQSPLPRGAGTWGMSHTGNGFASLHSVKCNM